MSAVAPLHPPHRVRLIGFVLRCAASASIACWLSDAIGLNHTVWASMSALIVSQEKIDATRAQVIGRIAGTVIGALVALGVHLAGAAAHPSLIAEVAVAVALCALIASGRPTLRVCLWTCPLVLLTNADGESPEMTALARTSEVLLGALVGGVLHHLEILIVRALGLAGEAPAPSRPDDPAAGGGE